MAAKLTFILSIIIGTLAMVDFVLGYRDYATGLAGVAAALGAHARLFKLEGGGASNDEEDRARRG